MTNDTTTEAIHTWRADGQITVYPAHIGHIATEPATATFDEPFTGTFTEAVKHLTDLVSTQYDTAPIVKVYPERPGHWTVVYSGTIDGDEWVETQYLYVTED